MNLETLKSALEWVFKRSYRELFLSILILVSVYLFWQLDKEKKLNKEENSKKERICEKRIEELKLEIKGVETRYRVDLKSRDSINSVWRDRYTELLFRIDRITYEQKQTEKKNQEIINRLK